MLGMATIGHFFIVSLTCGALLLLLLLLLFIPRPSVILPRTLSYNNKRSK